MMLRGPVQTSQSAVLGNTHPGLTPRPTFLCRPQGKSYLYFTQFKAEVRGAEIEYGMAYVSISCALGVGA